MKPNFQKGIGFTRPLYASEVIAKLAALMSRHGDLPVLFADGHDCAFDCLTCSVMKSPSWDGAPEGKAVYFS